MATHELYLGGPVTGSYNRSMFPAPPFNPAGYDFKRMRVSAHDPVGTITMGRTFDTRDAAVAEYFRTHTLEPGDVIRLMVFPAGIMIRALQVQVIRPDTSAGDLPLALEGVAGAALPTLSVNAISRGYAQPGDGTWRAESSILTPSVALLTTPASLTMTSATGVLTDVRVEFSVVADTFFRGDELVEGERGIIIRE